jgi:hypothetical protein
MFAKNARKSEEIASHCFGIVVLKIGFSSKIRGVCRVGLNY